MTTALAYMTDEVPGTKVTGVSTPRIGFLITACTPQTVEFAMHGDAYTDAQFYADLKKSGNWIDEMEEAALKEHSEGKTRKLP